jgi:putative transcriptional regulator
MTIYFTLREILVERGISERQFAHQAGIREGTLYDICNNEIKRLPIDVIGRICNTLDIDPCDWIKRKKDTNHLGENGEHTQSS